MGICFQKEAHTDIKNLKVIVGQSGDSNSTNSTSFDDDPMSQTDLKTKNNHKIINKQISKYMKEVAKKESRIVKLLLLGSGSSGKSTLFQQIECIHGEDRIYETQNKNTTTLIRLNCINGLIKLLKQSEILSQPPFNKAECIIDFEDENIANAITLLPDFKTMFEFGTNNANSVDIAVAGEVMELLWQLDGIQETYKNRHYFSLPENIDYFLDKISVVMDESETNRYIPSMEDVINAAIKTTGIIEKTYLIQNIQYKIFDAGGQRNERKKWIQLFDNVHAVIFVAALNHYCCVCFEDETVNGMQESLQLFEETVNSKWFSQNNTQWILFLNKNDLFVKRYKHDKIPLKVCFGDEFTGADYGESEYEFEVCYQEAINFIKAQYVSRIRDAEIRNNMPVHVTVATNKSNIQKAFDGVREGIIRNNLKAVHFV